MRHAEDDLTPEHDAALAEFVAAECARSSVPGCAVGIIAGDRSFAAVHGVTSTEDPLAVDLDTLFFIGSTTKTVTATVMMSLVEEGRLTLDDRVRDHLPGLRLADQAVSETVTIGQLFDHTAGWRGDTDADTGWGDDALARGLDEVVSTMPQLFPPGVAASYNNAAVVMAGRVIELLTGMPYEAAVRLRVLEPLGMKDSFFFPWEVATRRFAVGHVVEESGPRPQHVWPLSRAINPAGGLVSTVRDQLRYARFHLDGAADGTPPVSDAGRRSMQQQRVALPSMLRGIGLSWLLHERRGVTMVEHGGNCSNLYVSSFGMVPEEHFAVTVLTNSRGGSAIGGSITEWAMERHLGRGPVDPPPPLPMTPALLRDYVGRYDAGQWELAVTNEGDRLFVQMLMPEDIPEEVRAAFAAPPNEMVLVGPDVLAPAATPGASTSDFVRGDDGRVEWLRHGLRLARRVG